MELSRTAPDTCLDWYNMVSFQRNLTKIATRYAFIRSHDAETERWLRMMKHW